MTANVDAMVRAGIQAYKAGKKAEARTLLEKACELDQYNEQAWLWLSAVVESPEDQRTCLENVLFINPDNQNAKQGLQMLASKTGSTPPPAAATPLSKTVPSQDIDPFADLTFTSEAPSPGDSAPMISKSSAPAAAGSPFMEDSAQVDDEPPPTATSSASSVFKGRETSSAEYDDWVSGLNLKTGNEAPAEATPTPSPFANPDEIFGKDFFDDDDFDEGASADDRLGGSSAFTSGPFDAPSLDLPEPTPPPPPQPKVSAPIKSPGFESSAGGKAKSPAKPATSSKAGMSGDLFPTDDDFDMPLDEPDPSEYFLNIPEEIKPSRLPGTSESISPLLLLAFIALIVLNLGAVFWLISSFSG